MKWFDLQDEFYRPVWIRIVLVAVCLCWGIFEFVSGTPLWGVLFVALGVYCAYQFFVVFNPK